MHGPTNINTSVLLAHLDCHKHGLIKIIKKSNKIQQYIKVY